MLIAVVDLNPAKGVAPAHAAIPILGSGCANKPFYYQST